MKTNGLEKPIEDAVETLWQKVEYEVTTQGTKATVRCKLPKGFSMPEFTRIYDLKNAKDYNMSARDYIAWQHELLKQDLFNRLPVDKRYLLDKA